MKYPILLLLFLAAFFCACNKCDNIDCINSEYGGSFRLMDNTGTKGLVFGPDKVYDKEKIRFYAFFSGSADTTFYTASYRPADSFSQDSILDVTFFPLPARAFIDLGNGDTDTLDISQDTWETECCGVVTQITNFRYNSSVDLGPAMHTTAVIKK